jgi:hypothetical protein
MEDIILQKCSSIWYERECPRPATCGEYHYGQFGNKVISQYCDECYKIYKEHSKKIYPQEFAYEPEGFERYL